MKLCERENGDNIGFVSREQSKFEHYYGIKITSFVSYQLLGYKLKILLSRRDPSFTYYPTII